MNLPKSVSIILLLIRGTVRSDLKVVNPVRVGEFKFVVIVKLNEEFKCLAILVSQEHVLTPCDCVGFFVDEFLFRFYFPPHLKVIAGAVHTGTDSDDDTDAQFRTPYFLQKHPQCLPYVKDPIKMVQWIMYNYGLMTVSFPFNTDYRVAPIALSSALTIKSFMMDLIKSEGECKTVAFPVDPTNGSSVSTHLEWSHVQLKPTEECEREMCETAPNATCTYDEYYFFGKFCATERFLKARESCFNNSGAPVICGGTYLGHFGDVITCPKTKKGRFFMYSRFDWAIPFIEQNSGITLYSPFPTIFILVAVQLCEEI